MVQAYDSVRRQLQRSAGYNKCYYDIGIRPSRFEAGQWVWYFNPRKLQRKQMKWTQQYEGPYLILDVPTSVTAKIQQSSRTKPKMVHIDKLKKYEGEKPKKWSNAEVAVAAQQDGNREGATGPNIPPSRRAEVPEKIWNQKESLRSITMEKQLWSMRRGKMIESKWRKFCKMFGLINRH